MGVLSDLRSRDEWGADMSEAAREMTYDEMITNIIMHILALDCLMGTKRDLISHVLSLSYKHERDMVDAIRGLSE